MLKRVYRKLERTVFMMAMLWAQEIMSCETTEEAKASKRLCERHYARRHAEAEPGYGDGRSRKRCARTERGIGTGLISSDIFPLWRREAAPGNFRAAFIFLLLQALTRQLPLGGSLLKEHI